MLCLRSFIINTLSMSNTNVDNLLTRAAWIFLLVAILLGFLYFSAETRKHSILIIAIILILISALCVVSTVYYI